MGRGRRSAQEVHHLTHRFETGRRLPGETGEPIFRSKDHRTGLDNARTAILKSMSIKDGWTVIRVRGSRGLPAIGGAEFLSCVAALRSGLGDSRWHHQWTPDSPSGVCDGLRVELPFGSPELQELLQALEDRLPPPDGIFAEPMVAASELDPIQSSEEVDEFLDILWRYSDFLVDLRARNSQLTTADIRELTPGAFLTFVTKDRRHLETAMDEQSVSNVPTVSFGRFLGLIRSTDLRYRIPPANRSEAVQAARLHILAGCTFASRYYPFRSAG